MALEQRKEDSIIFVSDSDNNINADLFRDLFNDLYSNSASFKQKIDDIQASGDVVLIQHNTTGGIEGADTYNVEGMGSDLNQVITIPTDSFNGDYYETPSGDLVEFTLERILAHEILHAWLDAMNDPRMEDVEAREAAAVEFENDVINEQLSSLGLPGEPGRESYLDGTDDNSQEDRVNSEVVNGGCGAVDANGDGQADGTGSGTGPGGDCPALPEEPNRERDQGSPLVLDLDGDGVELYATGDYGTFFDLAGIGQAVLTGWVGPDDGLLALDVNANGYIDDIAELFGDIDSDGFTELALHDSNGDYVIDANDTVFNDLLVWKDVNSDGISQSAELHSLSNLNITSISLDAIRVGGQEIAGNTITHEASFTIDGNEQTIVDAWFSYDVMMTRNVMDYTYDMRVAPLPTLRGYGDLKDLYIAASIDNGATGETIMEQLIALNGSTTFSGAFADWSVFESSVSDLMLRWSGVDGIAPASRGSFVDARHLAFNEAFRGEPFEQYGQPNPLREAGEYSEAVYEYLVTFHAVQLVTQIVGGEIFVDASYNLYSGGIEGDLSLVQTGIDTIRDEAIAATDAVDVWTHFAQFLGYTKGLDNLTAAEITALDAAVVATGDPSLSNWQDVVSIMTVSLGSIIESSDDWGSFEVYYDNYNTGTSGDDVMIDDNAGGNTDNEFLGYSGNDTIQALCGHDKLVGGAGNDTLEGGAGDDYLLGGTGDDIYLYESGNDTISEVGGNGYDELHIMSSTGLMGSDLVDLYRYGDELIILLSTGNYITVHDYAATDAGLEKIFFDADTSPDGVIDITALTQQKFYGTSGHDNFTVTGNSLQTLLTYGYEGNDTITVSGGAGKVYGGVGYDTLIGDYHQ